MSKKKGNSEEDPSEKEKRKVDKWLKKHPNSGIKSCLKCGKQFMSTDVCRNRICVSCTRNSSRDWHPNVYRSGLSLDPDDGSF